MSAKTLTRIADETSARLATASRGPEAQAIGLDHMAKMGADLAEALFTHFAGGAFTDAQVNIGILQSLQALQRAVVESFTAFGVTDDPFLDQCLEASATGFMDRAEALFSLNVVGGAA